jgi:lipid-A-disaccharide synthase
LFALVAEEHRKPVEAYLASLGETAAEFRIYVQESHRCMLAADVGLIKSGTSTLEAGLLGLPHCVVYRPSKSTEWVFRFVVRYWGPFSLLNLVGGWRPGDSWRPEKRRRVVPEVLAYEVTPQRLAKELDQLLDPQGPAAEMKAEFERLRSMVWGDGSSPSERLAQEVVRWLDERKSAGK